MNRNFSENVSLHLLHDGVDGTGCIVLDGSIVVGSLSDIREAASNTSTTIFQPIRCTRPTRLTNQVL